MFEFFSAFKTAFALIAGFDSELLHIVALSLSVSLSAVAIAALIGLPHTQLGEEPSAVVHLAPGEQASEGEFRAWVGERLAKFKIPVRIAFSEGTLPRNATGKILKKDLQSFFTG